MVNISQKEALKSTPLKFLNKPHVLIIESRFYDNVADMLLTGATDTLKSLGASHEIITVPGALEIPLALQFAAFRKNDKPFDAFVLLGTIVRGDTTHYETVCLESNRGVTNISLQHNLPIGNCILTVENLEQALERADPTKMNKASAAAIAALTMLHLKQTYGVTS